MYKKLENLVSRGEVPQLFQLIGGSRMSVAVSSWLCRPKNYFLLAYLEV